MDKIELIRNKELARLRDELSRRGLCGGEVYEGEYSFWAMLVPKHLIDEHELIIEKRVKDLSDDEIDFLKRYSILLNISSLQKMHDEGIISKSDEIAYLRYRLDYPITRLMDLKLTASEIKLANLMIGTMSVDEVDEIENPSKIDRYVRYHVRCNYFEEGARGSDRKLSYQKIKL